jgi:mannosyl-oligosaccharide glucosidase
MSFNKYSNFIIFIIKLSLLIKFISSQPESDIISDIESKKLFSDIHNSKYIWGTYKPNLYFSMKQKQKETPVFGLMWYGIKEKYFSSKVDIGDKLRHECAKTDSIKYYWPYHNGLDYSNEIIKDEENNIILDLQNIKTNYDIIEQSWINVIRGKKINKKNANQKNNIGIILYFSLEEFSMDKKAIFSA